MAEDTSDMEKELLNEEEQDQTDEDLSTNERFMECYPKLMNDNICALGVSLNKRKHESIVSDQPSTNTAVRGVTTGGVWGVSHPPNLSKRYSRRAKTKKRSGKTRDET
jgi:hypothetical protein